jgi:hypothetical protein
MSHALLRQKLLHMCRRDNQRDKRAARQQRLQHERHPTNDHRGAQQPAPRPRQRVISPDLASRHEG